MKICVLVNVLSNVQASVYQNHIHFFTYTAKHRPDIEFVFAAPPRMSIDRARNEAAKIAMQFECEYLMFIDDDVLIPADTLIRLLEHKKDIIAGLVIIRGYPFNVMAFKEVIDEKGQLSLPYYNDLPKDENGKLKKQLVKCGAIGFSCALIHTDVLRALPQPYFITGTHSTEDVYFCVKTRQLEPAPEIWMDTGIKCGHLLAGEPIEYDNVEKFREFYKEDAEKKYTRDMDYINANKAKIAAQGVKHV